MPVALITGCRTGFGHGLARRLLEEGWHVVATDPEVGDWTAALPQSERLTVRALDVRNREQIDEVVAQLDHLDLLVNNGGYAIFGSIEEANLDDVADLFDVNVLGVARVTQAALPLLRAAKGTIVMLSSVAGRTAFPESGYYAATKHAVEAMSDALVQEVGPLGVRLRVVEPGSFDTQFLATASRRSPEPPVGSPYVTLRPTWGDRKQAVLEPPQAPQLVVDAIVASLAHPTVFERVVVGADAERILAARDLLGADGYSLLCAERNGVDGALGALDDDVRAKLAALGHLDHRS